MVGMRGLVMARARSEPLLLAAALLSILLATTTLVALAMYASSVVDAGARRALATMPVATRSTTITGSAGRDDVAQVDRLIQDTARRAYPGVPLTITMSAQSGSYVVPGQEGRDHPDLLVFGTHDRLAEHARLVAGSWPAPGATPEAAVSQPVATALGLQPGKEITTESRITHEPVKVRITGVFQLEDPFSDLWQRHQLLVRGVERGGYTTFGPLMVPRETFVRHFADQVSATWMLVPDLGVVSLDRAGAVAAGAAGLKQHLDQAGCYGCGVSSRLPEALTQLATAALVARSTMLIPVLQLLLLSAYALVLTARLLADHRRMEVALLRARGAGNGRLALLAGTEALLVALPAAAAAPFLAPPLLRLVNLLPWIGSTGLRLAPAPGPGTFLLSGGVALACAVLLALPALAGARRTYVEVQTARAGKGLIERAGADVLLLGVAALALWQLARYGGPVTASAGGELGIDPLIVSGPALALLTGGLLGLRLVPRVARLIAGMAARRSGLAPALGAWQVSRRPLRYAGPALLLTMAVAIGVISMATAATWRTSQLDQARHEAGTDLRIADPPDSPELGALGRGATFRALPGVTSFGPVHRGGMDVGGKVSTALAMDAGQLGSLMTLRPDLSRDGVSTLAQRLRAGRPALPALPASGGRLDFGVRVTAEPAFQGLEARAVLVDGMGVWRDVPLGTLKRGDNPVSVDASKLTGKSGRLAEPIALRGLTFDVPMTPWQGPATVEVHGLPGARWTRLFQGRPPLPAADLTVRPGGFSLALGAATRMDRPQPLVVLVGEQAAAPLPAVVNRDLAQALNLRPAETRNLVLDGWPVQVTVAGIVEALPTTRPGQPALLLDLPSLQARQQLTGREPRPVTEWWARVAGGDAGAALEQLRRHPAWEATAVELGQVTARLRDDPLAGGLQGALVLGFLAALLFAVLGFVVNAAVAARERMTDFGILRALGVSFRQLSGLLAVEQAFVIGLSLAVGTALAAGIAVQVVPRIVLTGQATTVTPGVLLDIPWGATLGMLAAVTVLLAAVLAALARTLRRQGLGRLLRIGDER
ncbi:ABC transporter permease [Thermoactinospora rubra]|uniref:ABC transporter permease n=1 Tax=Thermoactinospora rubra TaxID=1088767 RepID=UPI000A11AB3A|nr:ABC transporter permease [Thermoactinospora rubra]